MQNVSFGGASRSEEADYSFYNGFKSALSENNLYQGTFYAPRPKVPSSPKLCNFMADFEYGSVPSKIHVI